ncbi:hypothetical protein AAFF_G00214160 [Aldrovandia affinis]|uniref:Uncharacterized protein n=1 Tax=Aldrovandia affinis TaxID=143900 RepID=A0AAD7W4F1_9TELE|nr:hypothetical protein AAFF_G00214160 [Aldrovandia affinis]
MPADVLRGLPRGPRGPRSPAGLRRSAADEPRCVLGPTDGRKDSALDGGGMTPRYALWCHLVILTPATTAWLRAGLPRFATVYPRSSSSRQTRGEHLRLRNNRNIPAPARRPEEEEAAAET